MKKKILIIILFIIIIFILGLTIYKFTNKNNNKENISEETEEKFTIDGEINIDEDLEKYKTVDELFYKLTTYASEIYDKNEYKSYNLKDGVYFLSLKEVNSKYNYDISMFKDSNNNLCDTDNSGIYFDIEHKLFNNENDPNRNVGVILVGCFDQLFNEEEETN